MPSYSAETTPTGSPRTTYAERLQVPLWWWVVAAMLVAVLGAEFHVGLPLWVKVVTYVVFGATAAFLLLFAGAVRIAVADGILQAGRARLPLQHAGDVRVLDRPAMHRLLGPQADPAAWTVTRPWVRGGVAVVVSDPADDTPYWLLSTRRPDQLAQSIATGRARATGS